MSEKSEDPRPLGGYAALAGHLYPHIDVGSSSAEEVQGRHTEVTPRVLLALATQHVSRLVAEDSILAPLRAPFTHFVEPTGEGEVKEEVVSSGLRHAAGELLPCPYCRPSGLRADLSQARSRSRT